MGFVPAAAALWKRLSAGCRSAWRLLLARLSLPLLARDLREQAARPRTYVIRVAYTALMSAIVFWNAGDIFQFLGDGLTAMDLGRGREIFDQIVLWQLSGILILTPVATAGAIAEERQRDTLDVLLTTQLGPGLIVREKFFSRLFVVCSLVAMSLPLLAFSYSLGGVSQLQLTGSIVLLITSTALSTSFSICLSARCPSAAAALVVTMVLSPAVIGPVAAATAATSVSTSMDGLWIPVACGSAGLSWLFLRLAQTTLAARGSAPSTAPMLEIFQSLDRFFHDLNDRFAHGRIIVEEQIPLPTDSPVAWRHRYRRSLGTTRYLVRMLLCLEGPALLIAAFFATDPTRSLSAWNGEFTAALTAYWLIVVLILISAVTGLIGAERSNGTLDTLLATPLSTTELLKQSLRGMARLHLVLVAPVVTLLISRLMMAPDASGWLRFVTSLVALTTLLLTLRWLTLLISLRTPSPLKATVTTSLIVAAWTILPLAVADTSGHEPANQIVSLLSPGLLFLQIETGHHSLTFAAGIATVYGLLACKLRSTCFTQADFWLHRC